MARQLCFPDLPGLEINQAWSQHVLDAHTRISSSHKQAIRFLQLEENEPMRLRLHSENITNRSIPLLKALENDMQNYSEWIRECAEALVTIAIDLAKMANALDEVYVDTD